MKTFRTVLAVLAILLLCYGLVCTVLLQNGESPLLSRTVYYLFHQTKSAAWILGASFSVAFAILAVALRGKKHMDAAEAEEEEDFFGEPDSSQMHAQKRVRPLPAGDEDEAEELLTPAPPRKKRKAPARPMEAAVQNDEAGSDAFLFDRFYHVSTESEEKAVTGNAHCMYCGERLTRGSIFCGKCGKKVE